MSYLRDKQKALIAENNALADRATSSSRSLYAHEEKRAKELHADITALEPLVRAEADHEEKAAKQETKNELSRQMKELGSIGMGSSKAEGSLGAPPLSFSKAQLAELHTAAGNRGSKAVISSVESPMSNTVGYNFEEFPFLRDSARLLDLVPVVPTDQPRIHFFRATAGASAAAAVAEGAAKPESSPVYAEVEAVVRKLAHFTRANDEVIADFQNFIEVIGREMLAGLIATENEQLLNGSGVAPNLTGLLNTTGIQTRAMGTDTRIDAIFKATNDLRTGTSFVEPDVIVLSPVDFGLMRAQKDGNGRYLLADPMSLPPFSLWGAKVLVTNRIAAGTALVANLKESSRVYLREAPKLEVAPQGGGTTEFIANQTLIRAEERLALAVVRPTALCKVTGLV